MRIMKIDAKVNAMLVKVNHAKKTSECLAESRVIEERIRQFRKERKKLFSSMEKKSNSS